MIRNLYDTIRTAAQRAAARWTAASAEDIAQEVWLRALEEPAMMSDDWVSKCAKRIANREYKRQKRRRTIDFAAIGDSYQNDRAAKPTHVFDRLVFLDLVANVVKDEFDRETIEVLSGRHPKCNTFRELALCHFPKSLSSAYRAKGALIARLNELYQERT